MIMTTVYAASTTPFQNPERYQAHYATLPSFRKEKIDALRFPEDKRRSLCAWLLLTRALGEYGISPDEIQIVYGEHGKPFLSGKQPLFFNLSHSGQRVLCAVSHQEVGCDVEQARPVNLKLAKRFFSPYEYETLSSLPQEERQAAFLRLWTCKESFVKAVGTGLSLPLQDFSIDSAGTKVGIQQSFFPNRSFFFRTFDPQDGYYYSCCAGMPDISELTTLDLTVPFSR